MDSFAKLNATRQQAVDAHNKLFDEGQATNRVALVPTGTLADDQTQLMEAAPISETVEGGRYIRSFGVVGREQRVVVNANGDLLAGTLPPRARDAAPGVREAAPELDDDDEALPPAAVSLTDDAVARPAASKRGRG